MARNFPSVTGFAQCKYDGGPRPGPATFGVLHDAETPLEAGYANSISSYFTRNTNSTSAHFMLDPTDTIQMLDTDSVGWHCGSANPRSIGVEQAGYAAFTLAEWSTPAAFAQEARVAQLMREIQGRHGIGLYWMSDQQLRDAHAGRIVGGWATHDQCSRVIGGSTHTDPAPNYPLARLMAAANGNAQEDDMTPDQATMLGEVHWMLEQMKPDTDRLPDEDAQTDLLLWAIADPDQGLRVQVASLQGQVAALASALSGISGGSGLDMAVVKAAADEAASKAATAALAGLADRLKPTA